jgi:xylan 1,4-beta-xylosidase
MKSLLACLTLVWFACAVVAAEEPSAFPVTIKIDAAAPRGQLRPIFRFFGADEPNYAYMKDGRKLIAELGDLRRGAVYFRTHNLLTSGDGTPALKWGSTGAYHEDAQGHSIYDWTIVDRIFDIYLEHGVHPYAQIGFMPRDLSRKPEPYQHKWTPRAKYDEIYTGWAYPPKDYAKWANLVYEWAKHCVEKYGRAEVEKWYWETWNEPNIGYWRGTREEFFKLHDYAIDAVRRALPTARVGGADTAGSGKFERDFLEHCLRGKNYATAKIGTPIDFISFHAKGAPTFINGHVRMGIANQLRAINEGFGIVSSFAELKDKPIVIGESDPDGCAACQGPQLGYRNGTMYSSYTAASFARKHDLAERHGVYLEGALTWAFEFEHQPYFAGFRVLASNGIDLPVMNVFRMFSQMNGQRILAHSSAETSLDDILRAGVRTAPDVAARAAHDDDKITILVWHYHDDDVVGPDAAIMLELRGIPSRAGKPALHHFRIDREHCNAFEAWKKIGSPANPSPEQYHFLERASQLAEIEAPKEVHIKDGKLSLKFALPRQAVSLFRLDLPPIKGAIQE